MSMLQSDENRLTTVETPKRNGKMVHGMEVNWPGIMVLVKYGRTGKTAKQAKLWTLKRFYRPW